MLDSGGVCLFLNDLEKTQMPAKSCKSEKWPDFVAHSRPVLYSTNLFQRLRALALVAIRPISNLYQLMMPNCFFRDTGALFAAALVIAATFEASEALCHFRRGCVPILQPFSLVVFVWAEGAAALTHVVFRSPPPPPPPTSSLCCCNHSRLSL